MSDLYIGLMSGTSVDGIDAALVDFASAQPRLVASHYAPFTPALREKILALCSPGDNEIQRLGELDIELGRAFATAVKALLDKSQTPRDMIKAIGSHGQTVRHMPHAPFPFTLQIGDPNIIAAETGITTIADFRRKDVALGGQGAPLVPAFHQHSFASSTVARAVVNIGGMANASLLIESRPVIGFDVGPGNVLLDHWIHQHQQKNHDENGSWAAQGNIQAALLKHLLDDPFFKLPPPKSTGREYFNANWLNRHLVAEQYSPVDVQATLTELTAQSILQAVTPYLDKGEILVCGGGAHNAFLMSRLQALAESNLQVASTAKYGLDPDWIEAIAFAWLARQTLQQQTGNLPAVTGSRQAAILGGVYFK